MYTFYFPRNDVRTSLREYGKSRDKFLAANPSIKKSELAFNRAYDQLIAILSDERIKGPVEQQIAIALPHDFGQVVSEKFVSFETGVINSITGARKNDSEYIILSGLAGASDGLAKISSIDALIALIAQTHHQTIVQTNEARELARKEKKKRKKQINASASYVAVGVTAIIANAFCSPGVFTIPSIGAGAGAVVKGSSDLYTVV